MSKNFLCLAVFTLFGFFSSGFQQAEPVKQIQVLNQKLDSSGQTSPNDSDWPEIGSEQKAWTRWWWMGNAVTKPGITSHLEKMSEANFGGVEISPIYGVEGYEEESVEYLSEEWIGLLVHTVEEARRLGMKVDMITGSSWPFGGSHVTIEDAARQLSVSTYRLEAGEKLNHRIQQVNKQNFATAPLHLLMGYSSSGESVELTEYVSEQGELDWIPEENSGTWQLVAFFENWTNMQVKRAAPGEKGHVIDHFSDRALENYFNRFDSAFEGREDGLLRAFFNDSYEVGGANWTYDFFDQFLNYRNYDLREYVPEFLGLDVSGRSSKYPGMSSSEITKRIRADFHETIHDLALNRFVIPWSNWAHLKGSLSRNKAHGFPANILDIYGAADIPLETLERLVEIAEAGGTVIFKNELPPSVTGYHNFTQRQNRLDEIYEQIDFEPVGQGVFKADAGNGQILRGENTEYMLTYAQIQSEPIADTGLNYIRRSHDHGHYYFISNLHAERVNK